MKLQQLKDTTSKIEQGAWVDNLPNLPGIQVKVRGWGNSDHRRLRAKMAAETSPEKLEDQDVQETLQADAIVRTILVDWRGLEQDDGAPLEYSLAMAEKIIHDPDVAVFRGGVEWAASIVAREGKTSLERDVKN
jgi:hypothetical protein